MLRENCWSCSCDEGRKETRQCSCRSSDRLNLPRSSFLMVVTTHRLQFCLYWHCHFRCTVLKAREGTRKRGKEREKKILSDKHYLVPHASAKFAWLVKEVTNLTKTFPLPAGMEKVLSLGRNLSDSLSQGTSHAYSTWPVDLGLFSTSSLLSEQTLDEIWVERVSANQW